ncbi:ankyrin repeat domain-containing protein [Paraburkholderia sp. C35]|uniref:ankyrin repeat domain-containing protein n=1 Tax=Paraburkholderia sp. C35 TaxID=2126993 RepID=UPI0013A5A4D3|nr:ankyrin repeat domain-containing protein [Paraburkholderia sp. C35]
MVQHPKTREELERLPLAHQAITQRQDLDKEALRGVHDLDENGNTVLHRVVAQMTGENSYDARTVYDLVHGQGVATDTRNDDGQTALDIARDRYEALKPEQNPGAARAVRHGMVVNLLNACEAEPGLPVPTGASAQALDKNPMLLRDQVYLDDIDGLRQSWKHADLANTYQHDPAVGATRYAFFEANSETMMHVLAKELGADPSVHAKSEPSRYHDLHVEEMRNTPLQSAIKSGDTYRAMCLIEVGANPDGRGMWEDKRPFELALERRDVALATRLLEAGASAQTTMGHGSTPLMYAVERGHSVAFVKTLMDHGADPNALSKTSSRSEWSPLHKVTDQHDPAVLDRLLDYGARPDTQAVCDDAKVMPIPPSLGTIRPTAQFMAAYTGNVNCARRMAQRGGDPAGLDTLNDQGNTALSLRLNDKDTAIVEKLLTNGAQPAATMATPMWRAMEKQHGGHDTLAMQMVRTRDAETLRQAVDEARQAMAAEQGQAHAEPLRPRMRARL